MCQLNATRPSSQSSKKRETTSPDQFCPTTSRASIDVVLVILKRRHVLTSCPINAIAAPNRTFGQPHLHMPPSLREESPSDRRAVSSAVMCGPIKVDAWTVSADTQHPNSTNSLRTIGSFIWRKKKSSRSGLFPRNIPTRGGCA